MSIDDVREELLYNLVLFLLTKTNQTHPWGSVMDRSLWNSVVYQNTLWRNLFIALSTYVLRNLKASKKVFLEKAILDLLEGWKLMVWTLTLSEEWFCSKWKKKEGTIKTLKWWKQSKNVQTIETKYFSFWKKKCTA